jgi:hypothetical protein
MRSRSADSISPVTASTIIEAIGHLTGGAYEAFFVERASPARSNFMEAKEPVG